MKRDSSSRGMDSGNKYISLHILIVKFGKSFLSASLSSLDIRIFFVHVSLNFLVTTLICYKDTGQLTTWNTLLNAHIAHVLHSWALAGLGSIHMPGMGNSAHNTIGYPSTRRSYALLEHIFITWKGLLLVNLICMMNIQNTYFQQKGQGPSGSQ